MNNLAEATREKLMATNEQYRSLQKEHTLYANELEKLTSKTYLNDQEQLEEVRLKKLKLRTKDQMEMLLHNADR